MPVSQTRIRVRYAETDQMGVVYHANHFIWFEVGRVELLRQLGFSYKNMETEDDCFIAVVDARCRYKAPVHYDDEVVIRTYLKHVREKVIHFGYELLSAEGGRLLAEGETTHIVANSQMKPRKLPENLPVERVVEPAPCACCKCGGVRLRKLGEVVSKTLECEPRRWKIVEHVREKFSCRDCEAINEPPAASHPIPRGFAGPSLLAMILAAKFLDHQPLNRQSAAFAREGVEIDTSTLADWSAHAPLRLNQSSPDCGSMFWLPSGFMLTTLRCRFWRRRKPSSAASGFICATIGHLAGGTRRRPFSNTRPPGTAPIHVSTWRLGRA